MRAGASQLFINVFKVVNIDSFLYIAPMKSLNFKTLSVQTLKGCAIYLAISSVTCLYGQTLDQFALRESTKIDSIVSVFGTKDKLKTLSFLPSVNYNFETGISVGFSLNNLIQFSQTKKRNKIEAMKLKSILESNLENKLARAEEEKEELLFLKDECLLNIVVLKHRYELYKVAFLQHTNNETTFSQYTTSQIRYLEKYQSVFSKINHLNLLLLKYFNRYKITLFSTDTLLKTAKNYEIAPTN